VVFQKLLLHGRTIMFFDAASLKLQLGDKLHLRRGEV
jgi:hypothetical protein